MIGQVIALVGPTGAGKSAVALAAASRMDAEIVAVDAFTVYRGMDIGTAKPSPAQRAACPHHMVDVLEPEQDCTVAWFQGAARAAVDSVLAKGRTALLVGGSGLYFRAVVDPLSFPPTDAAVRERITARFGADALAAYAELEHVDPTAAARIAPGNLRRTVRALEVLELTGQRFSDTYAAWDRFDQPLYPGLRVIGLAIERPALVARINARVDAMFAAGLVQECRALMARAAGGARLSVNARQAIGYSEVFDHLAGGCTLSEAVERMKTRSRRYAGRQQRWFAKDPRVQWVEAAEVVGALGAS